MHNFSPKATPVEPRNQADMDIIQNLASTSQNSAFRTVCVNTGLSLRKNKPTQTFIQKRMRISKPFQIYTLTRTYNLLPSEEIFTWFGINRPQSKSILHYFKCSFDGTNIPFQNWYDTDPNDYSNEEVCVANL